MSAVRTDMPDLWSTRDAPPFESYDQMRAEPVRWDESVDGWVVTNYDLCRQVLRGDATIFRTLNLDNREITDKVTANPRGLTNLMGDEHRRVHQWWLRLFSPPQVERYRETVIKPVVAATVDQFASLGQAELFAEFAKRIPIRVIAALMEMPWDDDEWFTRLASLFDRVGQFFDLRPGDDGSDSIRASEEITAMLLPFVQERRDSDGTDLISVAWREGPGLLPDWSERDVVGMVQTFFLAGGHTTTAGITNAAQLILTRPEIAAQIRATESLESPFVEETLRLLGPAHFSARKANEDVELGGVTIHRDQRVMSVLAAADRDPAKYDHPHDFELDRRAMRDHVAFNYGPRACPGAALARAEIRESVHALLHRLPNLRLDPAAPAPALSGFRLRWYRPLQVKFDIPSGPSRVSI
jgi:cytochrome P450